MQCLGIKESAALERLIVFLGPLRRGRLRGFGIRGGTGQPESGASLLALDADLFHHGLDEGFGAFDAGEDGLEVEGWLGGVAG